VVPPCSDRIARVPPYSRTAPGVTPTGLSPTVARLSRRFRLSRRSHWPGPRSLATTSGVSVDVLSSGYLDVSVPRVRLACLWIRQAIPLDAVGCPIRRSPDQSLLAAPRGLSQRAASFIASQCQGIHQMPLRRLISDEPRTHPRRMDPRVRSASIDPRGDRQRPPRSSEDASPFSPNR
jgi:hypothetical protein